MIFKITLNAIVWAVAIAGIIAMKKIQSGGNRISGCEMDVYTVLGQAGES